MSRLFRIQTQNKKGFVILTSLFIAVFLSVLVGIGMMRSEMQLRTVNSRLAIQESFYAAEAGIERAIFELRRNPTWDPGVTDPAEDNVPLLRADGAQIGDYTITLSAGAPSGGWQTRWIRSEGLDSLQKVTRILEARVLIENPARFLVSTMGDLRVGSGAAIDADVLARNLYFDVNESLPSPDKDINVTGEFVYWINSITGESNSAVHFGPTTAIDQAPSITFAGVDITRYRKLAMEELPADQALYDAGDLTVTLGDIDSSNPGFEPLIIFAEGDVTVSGTYGHSLLIVAGGNINIGGDILADSAPAVRPQIGLFANQDVIIPSGFTADSDLSIEAFIMAQGSGASNGEFIAKDDPFSLGTLNFTGAMSVRGNGRTGVDLNAFKTRNYNYNPELNINRLIPFTPFIVNILQWHESTTYPPPVPN